MLSSNAVGRLGSLVIGTRMILRGFRALRRTAPFVIPAIESMPRTPIRGRESTH